jgi:hypothetical protein
MPGLASGLPGIRQALPPQPSPSSVSCVGMSACGARACQSGRQLNDAVLVAEARARPEKLAVLYERYLNQV